MGYAIKNNAVSEPRMAWLLCEIWCLYEPNARQWIREPNRMNSSRYSEGSQNEKFA